MNPYFDLYMEGMSRAEIARRLNVDYSTACRKLRAIGITKRAEMVVEDRRWLQDGGVHDC